MNYLLSELRINSSLLDQTVARFKSMPNLYVAIRAECFNKKEADELKAYGDLKYPDIKIYYTWLEFERCQVRKSLGPMEL